MKLCPRCGKISVRVTMIKSSGLCYECAQAVLKRTVKLKHDFCNLCGAFTQLTNIPTKGYLCANCRFKLQKKRTAEPYTPRCPICGGSLTPKGLCFGCNLEYTNGDKE